jgi:hypothetical protein
MFSVKLFKVVKIMRGYNYILNNSWELGEVLWKAEIYTWEIMKWANQMYKQKLSECKCTSGILLTLDVTSMPPEIVIITSDVNEMPLVPWDWEPV